MEQVSRIKPLDSNFVVTVQDKILTPLKNGCCMLDLIKGDFESGVESIENATIIYNKNL